MSPRLEDVTILTGDCIEVMKTLPDGIIDCCVTSPPYYGLRDYGVSGQIGLEESVSEYVEKMVSVFREVRRVLNPMGTLWLNLGDSYAGRTRPGGGDPTIGASNLGGAKYRAKKLTDGLKRKDLIGIPWRVAFALQADGWYLRQDIIWSKPNPMPESVTDRCTKSHEYLFLLSQGPQYNYNADMIREDANGWKNSLFHDGKNAKTHPDVGKHRVPTGWDTGKVGHGSYHRNGRESKPQGSFSGKTGAAAFRAVTPTRNKRSVWNIAPEPFTGAHFATFPKKLVEPCIMAGCRLGGLVLDPFAGAGTTGIVAQYLGRRAILIELNPTYVEIMKKRTEQAFLSL